jgi:Xaa-Pro aminopeptidase
MSVLLYGDTERSPALRHEVPVAIGDPFLYLETDGRRVVTASSLERDRLERLSGLELIGFEELGWDELLTDGRPRWDAEYELAARAVERVGIRQAVVPLEFPLELADRLRAAGVELRADAEEFSRRRRAKSPAELEGIRRAQAAADAAMALAAGMLAKARPGPDGNLQVPADGGSGSLPVTAELVRNWMINACRQRGATLGAEAMVCPGAQGASGHEPGSGPLPAGIPIIIDISPRDEQSGCFADMTRTFIVGEVPDELADWHGLARDALERVREAVRPGVTGKRLWEISCDVFEAADHPTQRTKRAGEVLKDGFFHGLGHGVGLGVHEAPDLGRAGNDPLVEGDVVAIEPGTYRSGYGGVRLEDLVLVTTEGAETLTSFPYELTP